MAAANQPLLVRNVPDLAEFTSLTFFEIGVKLYRKVEATVVWCRRYGLLAVEFRCTACNVPCVEGAYARSLDGRVWRCPRQACRCTYSIRKGSFFEKSHMALWQILAITYCWSIECGKSRGLSQHQLKLELGINSNHTIVDWKQYCRDICVEYFTNHPQQIGGPGHIVEIDESLFAKRKYNRGRRIAEQWIFGGYDPETKLGFLVPVARHDAATLLPIIQQWIAPGTTIHSDMWAAYNGIGNLGYVHGTVNHRFNFVNPATGVHTNHVEAMWMRAKSKFKAQQGASNRGLIADYMAEFMWNQRFGPNAFYQFWYQIATELYVVN